MKPRKTLEKILFGPKNIRFDELRALVRAFGYRLSATCLLHAKLVSVLTGYTLNRSTTALASFPLRQP